MKATYYQRGETLDYTAAKKLEAGDVVSLGSRIGVAAEPVSAGQVGHVHVVGVFAMTKANTEIKLGAAVYYDAATDEITTTASKEEGEGDNKTTVNNTPAGYAVEAAATTATSVLVKLLG